uniref:Putative ovule protein n=1 Tax=Solanum chacoense TaxID=4108 RepID=A0A0V0H679_SOLCH
MITSWLFNSVSKDIGDSVIYFKTSRDLWMSLEHRFRQTSGAKFFHLLQEFDSSGPIVASPMDPSSRIFDRTYLLQF